MKAGDIRDDEAGAASAMLSTLQAEFGDTAFTAKDIMAILDAGAHRSVRISPRRKVQTDYSTRSVRCTGAGSIGRPQGRSAKFSTTASSTGRPSSSTPMLPSS